MKAFQLEINGETEIIAAETNVGALRWYCETTGIKITDDDFSDEDVITEIPEKRWNKIKIRNTDWDENDPTDKEYFTLKEMMEDVTKPYLISTTNQ